MRQARSQERTRQGTAPGLFVREWLRNPLRVGAVAPSGAALASAITSGLGAADGPVLELGPGTGAFTSALIARGIPPDQITAVEASPGFASSLALRFPQIRVRQGDAARLAALVSFDRGTVKTVICGLPLLSIPTTTTYRVMRSCFDLLSDDGAMRLFTYGPRCSVPKPVMARLGLVSQRHAFVPMNIPPASVHILRRV